MQSSLPAARALAPCLLALGALGATAHAADNDQGFYIGGGVGEFKVEIDDVDDVTSTIDRYDADDTAYKAFIGYRFAPFLAVEAAYVNLGSPDADILPGVRAETEIDGIAPYLVATLPLGPIEVFAKAGYFFYDTTVSVTSSLGSASADDDGEEFIYGGGVGITLLERLNVRLEYEVFDVEDTDDTNALWLTAAWRF
jgi:hypothetical protein